ncbi:hypothetical protein [Streptomyces sp. NPDC007369]
MRAKNVGRLVRRAVTLGGSRRRTVRHTDRITAPLRQLQAGEPAP